MREQGLHILTEGTDGTGKSTAADGLAERYREEGHEVIRVDEPASPVDLSGEALVPIANELRTILKNGDLERTPLTEVLLFTASRRESYLQVTKPALERGARVIQARSNMSTEVYQGYGHGYNRFVIRALTRFALGRQYMHPDHQFILDLSDETVRKQRIEQRGALEAPDAFESQDDAFQARLRDGYRKIAKRDRIPLIDVAGKSPDEVTDILYNTIESSSRQR